jgi:Fe2+ transport system protein B
MEKNGVINVSIVGNPNSGKTTLFNGLTGGKSKGWKLARCNC